ncbi:MAG: hypothetical protein GW802_06285 [Armatimonadetes bacterium]|nr:hypothetical protein [Armatimonadota bacterium]
MSNNNGGNGRHYQTAYAVAKAVEFLSWWVLIGGVMVGPVLAASSRDRLLVGIAVAVGGFTVGLGLVFIAQLTLIFIDTEDNTRQLVSEMRKTNAMLAETLSVIVANLNQIASSGRK